MRLSSRSDDPGYMPSNYTSRVRVFFNGAEVRGVFTADEEKRLIVQAVFDANGRSQLAPNKKEVLSATHYGDVRIELPTEWSSERAEAQND